MIIVSSLKHAEEAFRLYKPGYVISILDVDEPTPPVFDTLPAGNHIKLIGDCSRGDDQADCGGKTVRCGKIIDVVKRWAAESSPRPSILIHCHQGAARSMAVAYILMCAIEHKGCEKEIAQRLRKAAPHADPNLLLVSEADAALGRDDRMVEAILDLCPCCNTVGAPIVTLPVAS